MTETARTHIVQIGVASWAIFRRGDMKYLGRILCDTAGLFIARSCRAGDDDQLPHFDCLRDAAEALPDLLGPDWI